MALPRHANPAATEILEPRRLLAAQLVADLDPTPADSYPSHFTPLGNTLYFFATDAAGRELWKTDGTPAGTMRVTDLNRGPGDAVDPRFRPPSPSSHLEEIATSGGRLFFTATDGPAHGVELFVSDGTAAGTKLVKELNAGGNANPAGLTDINGQLFFIGTADTQKGVWKTDGTEAGTVLLGAFRDVSYEPRSRPTASGGLYYFIAEDPVHGWELWKSDGTPSGTAIVKDLVPGRGQGWGPGWLTDVDGTLYFYADDRPNAAAPALWKTDGTEAGTVLVKRGVWYDALPANRPVRAGHTVYFTVGFSLWKTDGTEAGTAEVLSSSVAGSLGSVSGLSAVGDRLFFLRQSNGPELWTSDGTPEGTVRVARDFLPFSAVVTDFTAIDDRLYFTVASPPGTSRSLWTSDGTPAGTFRIANLQAGPADTLPEFSIRSLGDTLFFPGYDAGAGAELWQTDGTAAGASRFNDLNPATRDGLPGNMATLGGELLFGPNSGPHAGDLLKTDGAEIVVLREGSGQGMLSVTSLTRVGDTVFFYSNDPAYWRGLWKTDGTAAGTVFVAGMELNASSPFGLVAAGNKLFYTVVLNGLSELWQSDGTAAGTVRVKAFYNLWSGTGVVAGGAFYFAASGITGGGMELWKTDGTPAGTVLVADVMPEGISSYPRDLTPLGDSVLFTVTSTGFGGASSDQVWRTDGTSAGTVALTPTGVGLADLGGRLGTFDGYAYFGSRDAAPGGGAALWKSDGTPDGTAILKPLPAGFTAPDQFAVVNGLLYFRATDAQSRSWLWRTDGTATGTLPVRRFETPAGQPIDLVGNIGGALHFTAEDGTVGRELWRSDGTDAGTVPVTDIFPGPYGSYPNQLLPAGTAALFFTAIDPGHGRELWKYTPDFGQPAARVAGRHVFYNNSVFDGRNTAANGDDDRAIATGKQALRPGQAASFANATSYTRGINGLMVDVSDLRDAAALGAGDFTFELAPRPGGGAWTPAPAPQSVTVHTRAGADGSDRITLTWADGAIRNTWLRVTVKANANTGLAAPDVFYFGNLVGEVGDPASPRRVSAFDLAALRRAFTRSGVTADLSNPHDVNRDGRVNASDFAAARANLFQTLRPITTAPAAIAAADSPVVLTLHSTRRALPRRTGYALPD